MITRLHFSFFLLVSIACSGGTPRDAGFDGAPRDGGRTPVCAEPFSVPTHGRCQCVTDCAGEGVCFTEEEFARPGGECISTCGDDTDCPAGPCFRVAGEATGVCQHACTVSTDCPTGQRCLGGACAPWCDVDEHCLSGHCEPYTHLCSDGAPREGGDTGAPCLNDDECRGACYESHGRCTTLCSREIDSCPSGAVCTFDSPTATYGICQLPCDASDECPDEGLDCVQLAYPPDVRACIVAPTDTRCAGRSTRIVDGAPCSCGGDCAFGMRCFEEWQSWAPHGACMRACDAMDMRVSDDPSCGEGRLCHDVIDIPTDEGGGACFARCESTADCPYGRICSLTEGCVPFCQSAAECYGGECDTYRGACRDLVFPARAGVGAVCDGVTDCRSSVCRRNATSGFCSARCDVTRQLCPDNAVCVDIGDGSFGACMPPCTEEIDCASIPGATCVDTGAGLPRHCDLPDVL